MKTTSILFILIFTIMACKENKDPELYIDNHLNEPAHVGNTAIKEQKESVLKVIMEFDNWYRVKNNDTYLNGDKWHMDGYSYAIDVPFDKRVRHISDSVMPVLMQSGLFTNEFVEKVKNAFKNEKPNNLGYILSGSNYGYYLKYITQLQEEKEYYMFHTRYFLNEIYSDDIDHEVRPINYEEAKFYHLSMIKLYNDNHAVYKVHTSLLCSSDVDNGFLILDIIKEQGSWKIDDMYFIENEELVENPEGYTLLDYFLNK